MQDTIDMLFKKIKTLSQTSWEGKVEECSIDNWIDGFNHYRDITPTEKLNLIFLISNVMYFGNKQIRELLKALYRDLFKYPVVEKIRKDNGNTKNLGSVPKTV